ncbi:MAG: ParB/RepB/Spo0J family partition protein [Desulfobacterales bacterium]|nr:ParB/RepB/Spo0J family partition protein [Desulfobacterales bacterium]
MKNPKESKNKTTTTPPKRKKMALGKGLGALIPELPPAPDPGSREFMQCDIDRIRPNRYQPRRHFAEPEMAELAASIRQQGILQPLLVRKTEAGFELVAGERRLRAARMAGLKKIPVVIKDLTDSEMLEISIVENIQREDFNPIEEAEAYHRLITEFKLTQDQAAERVGKSRSAVANFLRLRQLPDPIKETIIEGSLSMGHARALLGAERPGDQVAAWREVLEKKLSVRQTEELIKRMRTQVPAKPAPVIPDSDAIYFQNISEDLSRHFGTKVLIKRQNEKGTVEIEFYNNDDLDRLLNLFRPT